MFADQDFADFSQEIGLASLGASDEDIKRLATCYWHSVEFGLVKSNDESGNVKAYGAGLLSSFGELEYSSSKVKFFGQPTPEGKVGEIPKLLPWDPKVAATTEYPICTYQPVYFVANSLADAKVKMRSFCESLPRPFYAKFNTLTNSVWVDRAVRIDQSSIDKLPKGYAGAIPSN
jgi:phenylalanine-4-hydroxylase